MRDAPLQERRSVENSASCKLNRNLISASTINDNDNDRQDVRKNRNKYLEHEYQADLIYFKYIEKSKINTNYYTGGTWHRIHIVLPIMKVQLKQKRTE